MPLLNPTDSTSSVTNVKPSLQWVVGILLLGILCWFFAIVPRYGNLSAFGWVSTAWNSETDYEHGPLFPLVIIGLVVHQFKAIRQSLGEPNAWGLLVVLLGAFFYVIGFRTLQPRITLGSLPFLVWGCVLCWWGFQTARKLIFPVFFFWLAIPLPSFQQATVHLQLLATKLADLGAGIFGVETVVQGTAISSANGEWAPLEIAKGCSGIRSLMALIMIAAVWAYVSKMSLWKRLLLFFSALPVAIIGNALRVTSIFVISEYGDAKWAAGTWHDWSGLLLFYPISLMLLLFLHTLLEGGLPWRKSQKRRLTSRTVKQEDMNS
ncbi:exosortase/archaeosortase family protein [Luteolibacter sp. AS25]|uniref:exosortase/archaeosortase family protein n=1 Tax=Luteolibacter sp. AS25 TaxID=3135776 RepID=UPI00398A5495